jgi:hypothetical protein
VLTLAGAKLQQALSFGSQADQMKLDSFVVDQPRMAEAVEELAMYFYTSNTPPERASNKHLQKSFALLGAVIPEPRDFRGSLLDAATVKVKRSTLEALLGKRWVMITDGWSKRTADRGTPLINVMICPDDGPAVAWRVADASCQIKDTEYVAQLHRELRAEIEATLTDCQFLRYVMDSTATNRAAIKILQAEDPSIVVLPCAAHAFSNLIEHAAKFFEWIDKVYSVCCTVSDKLIASEKLRSALHQIQQEEYAKVRGICAHVPTRFGSRLMVLRDVQRSRAAIRRLAATAEWRAAVTDSAPMKRAHELIFAVEDDLFDLADKLEKLLGSVMDAIHQLEADSPCCRSSSRCGANFRRTSQTSLQTMQSSPKARCQQTGASATHSPPKSRLCSCSCRTTSSCGILPWTQVPCLTLYSGRRMRASCTLCLLR